MRRSWVRCLGSLLSALGLLGWAVSLRADPQQAPDAPAAPVPPAAEPPSSAFPAAPPANPAPAEPPLPAAPPVEAFAPAATPVEPPPPAPPVEPPPQPVEPSPSTTTPPPSTPSDAALPSQWALDTTEGYDRGAFDPNARNDDPPRKKDPSDGIFGPFRIGLLVGSGLPSVINGSLVMKFTRYLGAGVNIGVIPTVKMSIYGKAEISYQEYDGYVRVHPFGGGFFLGSGIGYAHAQGAFTRTDDTGVPELLAAQNPELPLSVTTSAQGSVKTLVVIPQLGYFQIFGPGFTVSVDFGVQLPIAPSKIKYTTKTTPDLDELPANLREVVNEYYSPNSKEVRDTLETVGRTPIPSFSIKLGWVL